MACEDVRDTEPGAFVDWTVHIDGQNRLTYRPLTYRERIYRGPAYEAIRIWV